MIKHLLPAAVLLAVIPASSQGGPSGMEHGPMGMGGPTRTPVTNAPYSATFTSTSTEKLQDGTVLNHSSTRTASRDSLGRTREEITMPSRGGADGTGKPHTMILILDPVAHTVTQLRTEQKVAVVHVMPEPRAGSLAGRRRPDGPDAPTAGADAAAGAQLGGPHLPREDKNVQKADLGSKTISGIVAMGKRVTRTIPAGEIGNVAPVISTHEDWFSPDLKIEVSRTDVDPFHGTRTTVASALSKAEPDAALFKVPEGYTIQQAEQRGFGRRAFSGPRRGEGVPPPPPSDAVAPAPGL